MGRRKGSSRKSRRKEGISCGEGVGREKVVRETNRWRTGIKNRVVRKGQKSRI